MTELVGDTSLEVLLIGGRSGVGKTSVSAEVFEQLQRAGVPHCLMDGDNLDAVYPKPPDDPRGTRLTEANIAALWRNYAALGHHRLVYVNTVSVLEADMVIRALGGTARAIGVLLVASDETARERLGSREIGSALDIHVARSASMAVRLHEDAPSWVSRVPTDQHSVVDIASAVIALTGWQASPHLGSEPGSRVRR